VRISSPSSATAGVAAKKKKDTNSRLSLSEKKKNKRETMREKIGLVPQTSPNSSSLFQAGPQDSGRPLDHNIRLIFENAFGYDFGDVRIHDDDRAAKSVSSISADAYTLGQDIFFAEGMYRPETISGRLLLAHELIHTVQQRTVARAATTSSSQHGPFTIKITDVHDPLESEARRISEHLVLKEGGLPLDTISVANVRGGKIISRQISRSAADPSSVHGGSGPSDMVKVSFVVETIVSSLEEDPTDKAGKVRNQLAGLNESLRQLVLDRLRTQLRADQLEFVHQQLMLLTAIPTEEEQETHLQREDERTTTAGPQDSTLKEHEKEEDSEEEKEEKEEKEEGYKEEEQQKKLEKEKRKVVGPPTTPETLQPSSADLIKEPSEDGEEEIADTPELQKGAMAEEEEKGGVERRRPAEGQAVEVQPAMARGGGAGPAATTAAPPYPAIPEAPVAEAEVMPADQGEVAAQTVPVEEDKEEEQKRRPQEEVAEAEREATIPEAPSLPPERFVEPIQQQQPVLAEESTLEDSAVQEPSRAPTLPDETALEEETAATEVDEVSSPVSVTAVEQGNNVLEESATEEEGEGAITASTVSAQGESQLISEEGKSAFGFSGGAAGLEDSADAVMGAGAGGGGGGEGGVPIEEPPSPPPVPDVSQLEPSAALNSISSLPPGQMLTAMSGVTSSVSNTVGNKRSELASNPPQIERPSGLRPGDATEDIPVSASIQAARRVNRIPRGESVPTPEPKPMAQMPPAPVENVSLPPMGQGGGEQEGQMSAEDASRVRGAVNELPTTDPALNVTAGPAPRIQLEGDADPENVNRQRSELDVQASDSLVRGRKDAVEPMGEDEIYPNVPQETLTAQIPLGGGAAAGAGGGGLGGSPASASQSTTPGSAEGAVGGATTDAVSIIAQEQRGPEITSAFAEANSEIATKQQEHSEKVVEANEDSRQEIDQLVGESATEQLDERNSARRKVAETRGQWLNEQDGVMDKSRQDADAASIGGRTELSAEQVHANSQASTHIQDGNKTVANERQKAEQKAASERAKAKSETSSKGFFGWLASKAKRFFNAIKKAIKSAFDLARRAVKAAIETAKRLAVAVIETARKAIVSIIKKVGDALIAIGDVVLAAFPELKEKFRTAIQTRVNNAVNKVNQLAEKLKVGVQKALDALGAALDAALGLLERGLLAAVDVVDRVVQGAIKFAQAVVDALLAFAALIADIAPNPGQWIRNLGAGVVDGVKNHLWRELKAAVMTWFNQKVEQVLGLGAAVWDMLRKGKISLSMVAKMAWEGIKSAIPVILVRLLIEKLVAMIVPAAGAVMAIVEAIQAAWGSISRIIQAFQKFFAFLRAVKGGNAGQPFAVAVAAGAVAVIDFISQWLIARLMRPASAVAGRLKTLALRIGKRLRRAGQAVRRGIARAGKAIRRAGGRVSRMARRIGRRVRSSFKGSRLDRLGRRIATKARHIGRRVRRKAVSRRKSPAEKLARAQREIPSRVSPLLRRGIPRIALSSMLAFWRIRYGLRILTTKEESEGKRKIVAANSPEIDLVRGIIESRGDRLLRLIHEIGNRYLQNIEARQAALEISEQRTQGLGREGSPLVLPSGVGNEGQAIDLRESIMQRQFGVVERLEMAGTTVSEWLHPRGRVRNPHPSLGRVEVRGIGTYPKILGTLRDIQRETGASDRQIGEAIQNISHGTPLPSIFGGPNAKNARSLASVARLINVEAARSDAAVVFGNLLRSSVGSGILTPTEALKNFPPSQLKAVASMTRLAEELNIQPQIPIISGRQATREQIRTQREMQIKFMATVIYNEMRAMNKNFLSEVDITRYIEGRWEQLFYSTRFPSSIQT